MAEPGKPRRPLHFGPDAMEAHGGTLPDPAEAAEAAHAAAQTVIDAGRGDSSPVTTARLVRLVEDLGIDTLAELWAGRPARSLPGALWRVYVLRAWIQRNPEVAAREYASGLVVAQVSHVIAGVVDPPGADEVRDLSDRILGGVFDGDLAVALERAAAFCRVVATGRAHLEDGDVAAAAAMVTTAEDLEGSARLWRRGALD
ncbi:hypothetical protein ASG73_15855 [Janibacter sp. Soil728]|uniref:hypothetical protein n=1 Tax=Janibacter sp. Soil728 TaxID=1736393 RepID=UPI0006F20AE5|nr:hypothetical protein [Janibacter sp. Soil728]KRE36123.1 hypothetical protein ASG73_15855 [Janibacter sp. Soil728]